jgi:dolichol kinase
MECLLSFGAESFVFQFVIHKYKIKINRNIILLVLLYVSQTWSFIKREERRLWVFVKKVLNRIFVPKRDKVTGKWRRLHKAELNDL